MKSLINGVNSLRKKLNSNELWITVTVNHRAFDLDPSLFSHQRNQQKDINIKKITRQ